MDHKYLKQMIEITSWRCGIAYNLGLVCHKQSVWYTLITYFGNSSAKDSISSKLSHIRELEIIHQMADLVLAPKN